LKKSRLLVKPFRRNSESPIRVPEKQSTFPLHNEMLAIATMCVCNLAAGRDGVTTPGKLA
jgi:hypothetical protein